MKFGPVDISVRKQAEQVQGDLQKAGYQFHKIDRTGSRIERWGGTDAEFIEQLAAIDALKQDGNAWSKTKKTLYKRYMRLRREVNWTGAPEGASSERVKFGTAYVSWTMLGQIYWDYCDSDCEDRVAMSTLSSIDLLADIVIGGSFQGKDALGTTIIGLQSNNGGGFRFDASQVLDPEALAKILEQKE
ncbi:MAG: hypothetical protein KGI38_11770 [Thaumarchaeota archaeon]|nr:hypothetical protein [Nitrososphaerota archaeon]